MFMSLFVSDVYLYMAMVDVKVDILTSWFVVYDGRG
jgi:hypothetical protein